MGVAIESLLESVTTSKYSLTIEKISKQFLNMENISTIRKLTAFILRQAAFYLALLADILDKNDIIENRESRGLEIDKLENKGDYQMRENEEVIEKKGEKQIFGFNSREKEINRESESNSVDCENLQIKTSEYGDTEICEMKNDFGR